MGEGLAGDTIEMIPKGFSKAVGIAAVCRIFDIAHEDTIVFGDSNNDLSMFEFAQTKIAMGNAAPGIKELADLCDQRYFPLRNPKWVRAFGINLRKY